MPLLNCPECDLALTERSYHEHISYTHLGTKCYFPGSDMVLPQQNDSRMTAELERANAELGGGQGDGGVFWCYWPGCHNGVHHSYKGIEGLKRHLRTKQRTAYQAEAEAEAAAPAPAPAPSTDDNTRGRTSQQQASGDRSRPDVPRILDNVQQAQARVSEAWTALVKAQNELIEAVRDAAAFNTFSPPAAPATRASDSNSDTESAGDGRSDRDGRNDKQRAGSGAGDPETESRVDQTESQGVEA
ncbi:hypothetical protein AAE478_003624 [Parahypoxylon ruwenzoriense]